jgi:predicted small lipoprotein YifL
MRYATVILTLVLITGCGSKGPLYLLEEDAAAEQPAASQGAGQEPVPEPLQEQEDDVDINL